MRYYCFNEQSDSDDPAINTVVVMSEQEIINEYYDYWYDAMCSKFGEELVDRDYCVDDCIDDWCIVNYAWENINE
jgi:hypothetical protein